MTLPPVDYAGMFWQGTLTAVGIFWNALLANLLLLVLFVGILVGALWVQLARPRRSRRRR